MVTLNLRAVKGFWQKGLLAKELGRPRRKYGHTPASPASFGPFLTKLASKNQSVEQRRQASKAVRLFAGGPTGPTAQSLTPVPIGLG
jgi:hypothetical protein